MAGSSKTAQRGFTLMEVLVAVAVIALGLGAFISGGAQYADYAAYIRDRTIAEWVARDQLVDFQIAPDWPGTGKQQGDVAMGNGKWRWQADVQDSPDPQVRRIDMRVFPVDPATGKPAADSILLISGFVTQHPKSNAPIGATPATANQDATSDSSDGDSSSDDSSGSSN